MGSVFNRDHDGDHDDFRVKRASRVQIFELEWWDHFYLWIVIDVNILGSAVIQRSHLQT